MTVTDVQTSGEQHDAEHDHHHHDEAPTCDDLVVILDDICEENDYDYSVEVDRGHETMWGARVRLTLDPNGPGIADRSMVTHACGGQDATDVLDRCIHEMLHWLDEVHGRRGAEELKAAEQEYSDRLWHYRATVGRSREAAVLDAGEDEVARIEAKYTDLVITNEYGRGVVEGRLAALRWMLGSDWGEALDT